MNNITVAARHLFERCVPFSSVRICNFLKKICLGEGIDNVGCNLTFRQCSLGPIPIHYFSANAGVFPILY